METESCPVISSNGPQLRDGNLYVLVRAMEDGTATIQVFEYYKDQIPGFIFDGTIPHFNAECAQLKLAGWHMYAMCWSYSGRTLFAEVREIS